VIHTGDCIEVMAAMEADSVDAVVTDPPYGLEFMGKGWDKFGGVVEQQADVKAWPNGSGVLVEGANGPFGGGGQRIRYAAGPSFQAWCTEWGREALRVTKPGGYLLAFGGTRTHHRLVCGLEDAGWIIRDELDWIYASGFPKGKANLKPAHEPIVLARKPGPLRPLAIDECRIGTDTVLSRKDGGFGANFSDDGWEADPLTPYQPHAGRWPSNVLLSDPELFDQPNPYVVGSGATATTRGPVEHSQAYEHMFGVTPEGMSLTGYGDTGGYSRFFLIPKADRADREPVLRGQVEAVRSGGMQATLDGSMLTGSGNEPTTMRENAHPTVKPTDLMRHLVRLVTPSGGTVLDPFLGSGSTALACELEGFPWIGIEKEPEYVAIAEARLNGVQRGLGLDVGAPVRARKPIKDGAIGGNGLGSHYDRLGNTEPGVDFRDKKFADEEPAA
jgi:DNA modification methylase